MYIIVITFSMGLGGNILGGYFWRGFYPVVCNPDVESHIDLLLFMGERIIIYKH